MLRVDLSKVIWIAFLTFCGQAEDRLQNVAKQMALCDVLAVLDSGIKHVSNI
jgi:hypothetical protein